MLKFYREEGESGTLNEEREANWWTKSAVRRLKSSVTTPDRPTNQVPSEDSARMKGKETTSNRISEKWNELTDERAIVLKFYREEGESGTLNEEREANWWTKSAVRRLKSSVTTPDRPTNQVPSEDSARMKGKETEQKIPNQSVFRNTLNVSNIDTIVSLSRLELFLLTILLDIRSA